MTEYDYTLPPTVAFTRSTVWPKRGEAPAQSDAGVERETQRQEHEGPNGERLVYERWFSCGPWKRVEEPTCSEAPPSAS